MFSMVWCVAFGWIESQLINDPEYITIHLFSHSHTMCTLVFHLSLSLNFVQIFSYIQSIIYTIPIERLFSTFTILVHKSRQKCLHSFYLTRSCTRSLIHSLRHSFSPPIQPMFHVSFVTQPSRYTLTCPFDTSLKINIAE